MRAGFVPLGVVEKARACPAARSALQSLPHILVDERLDLWRLYVATDVSLRGCAATAHLLAAGVRTDAAAWAGRLGERGGAVPRRFWEPEHATFGDIFDALAPPQSAPSSEPAGLKTRLFGYQRRAVGAMLAYERRTTRLDALQLAQVPGPLGTPLLVNPGLLRFCSTAEVPCDEAAPMRGGILCEEMGVGKTLEILALCLLTKNSMPLVHPSIKISSEAMLHPDRLPSLAEHCAHVLHGRLPADVDLPLAQAARLAALLRAGRPFYEYQHERGRLQTPRHHRREYSWRVHLARATLVVVPRNLAPQWRAELEEHVESSALSALFLLDNDAELNVEELLAHDLVVMSDARLALESHKLLSPPLVVRPRKCECRYAGASRTVLCTCPPSPSPQISALLRVHFRRLVVDEGDTLRGRSRAVDVARAIAADSRWIVSGTPTSLLSGGADVSRLVSEAQEDKEPPPEQRDGALSSAEAHDLSVLGSLFNFLYGPSDHWTAAVDGPLRRGEPLARHRFADALSERLVRNPLAVVEADNPPPRVVQRELQVVLPEHQRLTYNALMALVQLNAVLSRRTGSNYLFHKENTVHLAAILHNMVLAAFFLSPTASAEGSKGSNLLAQAAAARDTMLEELQLEKREWTDEERAMAHEADARLHEALQDAAVWTSQGESAKLGVLALPSKLCEATSSPAPASSGAAVQLAPSQIQLLQIAAYRSMREQAARGSRVVDEDEMLEEMVTLSAKAAHGTLARIEEKPRPLPSGSVLHAARIVSTTSSKMTCVLNLVRHAQACGDKIIVFSDFTSVLSELSSAFGACHIEHALYTPGQSYETRTQAVALFCTDASTGVLLMKTSMGARGLTLTAANRSIFVEPVLDAAVRKQALKRTWRVGQTKDVHVTTLVAHGTHEPTLLRRGDELLDETARKGGAVARLAEDETLRAYLRNPQYVPRAAATANDTALAAPIPLFPLSSPAPLVVAQPLLPAIQPPPLVAIGGTKRALDGGEQHRPKKLHVSFD